MKAYVGIDPGKSGGIAVVYTEDEMATVMPMPVNDKELDIISIRNLLLHVKPVAVWMEKVHAMPGQGVVSMFSFGYVYGQLHGLITAMGFPLHLVAPQAWKKEILRDTDRSKQAAIAYVKRVYPNIFLRATSRSHTDHDGMAEAVCIGLYGLKQGE